ncbi:hypothetical protein [Amycolatopsis echigonensis]|uniref:Uncharacterized protein n=1 Tax=Amycolatopsis echigonensis TaxID=2576905 RepID=A0A8E1W8A1_9PSEU|nr:hypothetical protein [Amycolatopsis echigonensis]MBB2506020.1 hypothetical protein [Amycolatopsis echigonensis]
MITEPVALGKCRVCRRNDTSSVAYACNDCVNHLVDLVRGIVHYATDVLPDSVEPVRGQTGRMSPGYGSTPPLRLDVVAALDPRSLPGDVDEHGDAVTRRPDDSASWVRSIPRSLEGLADSIAGERDESRPGGTLTADADYIRRNLWWVADQPWVDDVADDIAELHHMARALARDAPQQALGACLNVTCGGRVFWGGVGRPAQCEQCKRTYDGLDLVRLEAAQGATA